MRKQVLIGFLLFLGLSLMYRMYGIFQSTPFWVDEFSTANQARLILQNGFGVLTNDSINFEPHNGIFHAIIAFFFFLFGQTEAIARLPSVIIGALVPGMLFVLAKRFFNTTTAIIAGVLATTSYFEIAWSRQARSYVFVQIFVLLVLYLYFEILFNKKRSPMYVIPFILAIALGILTHSLFYIFILALSLHFILTQRNEIKIILQKPQTYFVVALLLLVSYFSNFLPTVVSMLVSDKLLSANNVWYYHSFLWREYGLVTYLALLGFVYALFTQRRIFTLVAIYFLLHLVFINFSFQAYVSRYLLPLWPLILLMVGLFLSNVAEFISKKTTIPATTIGVLLVISIIINGNKFVLKPKPFYSVNHDFREIALVDYNQVYDLIQRRGSLEGGDTAVIDTWPDRLRWYLGYDYKNTYIFRWIDEDGKVNGLAKKTVFYINDQGEKILPKSNNTILIGELSDLQKVLKKFPKGFIFIDDSSLPQDVIEYVQKNFKKELYLDHYPLDDNPYSMWPATLYSWGITY